MKRRSAAAALAGGLALSVAALAAVAEDVPIPREETPLVGMAFDPSTERLWLGGARADRGVFVDAAGESEVSVNADLVSVQALAWYGDRLWVGDIGDDDAQREQIVVYRLASPESGSKSYHAYDFRYEDGPRDAKAMLISGRGNVYIVSNDDEPGIYRVRGEASRQGTNTLVRVAEAPAGVTDGVFLTDGATMALRTAEGIEYIDAMTWESLAVETLVGAPEGESITVGLEDELFVGGTPSVRTAQVVSQSASTTVTPVPPEASAPPGEGPSTDATDPTSGAPETGAEEVVEAEGPARAGTITALVLAGLVAVAAGLVTYFWRN